MSSDEINSLQTRIANIEKNLRRINERKSEYVLTTDIPPQLERDAERAEESLSDLQAKLKELQEQGSRGEEEPGTNEDTMVLQDSQGQSNVKRGRELRFILAAALCFFAGAIFGGWLPLNRILPSFSTASVGIEPNLWDTALTAMWSAWNSEEFPLAYDIAGHCVNTFGEQAASINRGLESAGTTYPDRSPVTAEQQQAILGNPALNSAAACYYVRGATGFRLGNVKESYTAYAALAQLSHARVWDAEREWFWSPATIASEVVTREFSRFSHVVSPNAYPFESTEVTLTKGDLVSIEVNGGTWACQPGIMLSAAGKNTDAIPLSDILFSQMEFCRLVGYIGDESSSLDIGLSYAGIAPVSGMLYLGANDVPTFKCQLADPEDCFRDNQGQVTVEIIVHRE